jgi:hypothetical protein
MNPYDLKRFPRSTPTMETSSNRQLELATLIPQLIRANGEPPPGLMAYAEHGLERVGFVPATPEAKAYIERVFANWPDKWDFESLLFLLARGHSLPDPAKEPEAKLNVYEITAAGFNASSSDTDDRVLFVAAASADIVEQLAEMYGGKYVGKLDHVSPDSPDVDATLPRDELELRSILVNYQLATRHVTTKAKPEPDVLISHGNTPSGVSLSLWRRFKDKQYQLRMTRMDGGVENLVLAKTEEQGRALLAWMLDGAPKE